MRTRPAVLIWSVIVLPWTVAGRCPHCASFCGPAGSHKCMTILKQVEQNSFLRVAKRLPSPCVEEGGTSEVRGKHPGAGCAHLNSSRIPESVQVQTAQTYSGPRFQEVLPSAFSQSLLKKRPLLSGNNCSIMDIRRGVWLAQGVGDSHAGAATWD